MAKSPQHHFLMLNKAGINAFEQVTRKNNFKYSLVIEVGTGSELTAIMAAESQNIELKAQHNLNSISFTL